MKVTGFNHLSIGTNPIEIDWPDVETLDRSRISEVKLLSEFAEQSEERSIPCYLLLKRCHSQSFGPLWQPR